MATEFGTGKTIFILAIVVGCFAILWPKIFYPMLQSSVSVKPNIVPPTDCCDVIFEKDLNAIKIMTQLCERILSSQSDFDKRLLLSFQHGKLTKEIVNRCNAEVHSKCDVDIREFLMDKVRLGRTYQQMLNELRSLNSSFCLKTNFGISPGLIGAPRRMRVWEAKNLRQERPPHLRPHVMHPALREKGRAIPHSHIVPRVMEKETPSAPLPMPGMRPPMGGAGHVVPAPKGSSTMGIILPLYTIGIVIFFMYTMMRLIFKKSEESTAYKEFQPDPEFRRVVFSDTEYTRQKNHKVPHVEDSNTKLGDIELDQLRRRLEETEAAMERIVAQMSSVPHKHSPSLAQEVPAKPTNEKTVEEDIKQQVQDELEKKIEVDKLEMKIDVDKAQKENKIDEAEEKVEEKLEGKAVQVVGMEMTESLEGGHKWSRPPTPVTPTVTPTPPPQSIYLEGSLPSQSQLLVSQSEIEKLSQEGEESPVILAGKVTLSLIGLDDTLDLENEGPMITSLSSNEGSEEELEVEDEEEEVIVEQVSEDEAEVVNNVDINGDEDLTTNYTTASAAGGLGDETAADFSMIEHHHGEEKEDDEVELEEDIIQTTGSSIVQESKSKEENDKVVEEGESDKDVTDISSPSNDSNETVKLTTKYDDEEEIKGTEFNESISKVGNEEEVEEEELQNFETDILMASDVPIEAVKPTTYGDEKETEDKEVSKSREINEKEIEEEALKKDVTDILMSSNAPIAAVKPEIEYEDDAEVEEEVEEDEEEEEEEEEDEEEDIIVPPTTSKPPIQEVKPTEEEEEEEDEVEDEEEEELEEGEEEEIGRPQSLQHQHQR